MHANLQNVLAKMPFMLSHPINRSIKDAELYQFFGGDNGPDIPMHMTWHHLAFNESEQLGFGEYSFQMHGNYHGIVIVKIENGLIKFWREYQYPTELSWEEFSKLNSF